jgi:flagellin
VANTSVLNVQDSNAAIAAIDAALQQVAATGAQLGAYQNRFTAAITGLNTDSTNLQSARSSIQDTDYAAATSQLSQAQILQQASTAMVAQANTVPQNVLTLLQKLP